MDVTTVEKSLRRIADSSDKRYDEVEKQNAKFIIAALDNGLVECTEIFQDTYYRFKIAGSKRVYEVCFGIDPPKTGEHARAERALRASGFIIDLQGLIDKEYNCYVVPDVDIRGPKASKLRERVFGVDSEVLVTETKGEKGSGSAAVSYGFVYELEVMINAAVDYDGGRNYEYVRINDSVVVEARVEGEKLSVSYEHKHIDRKTAKDAKVENISEEQLSTVRKVLAYVASNEEKRKILEELAKSEESGFSKRFLSLLPNMKDVRVGQVSVEPCAIYVDRIPNKTFAYDVTLKGHTQPFVLKLTWNDLDTRFKMTTPLYVVAGEDGSFEGFTYESEYAASQNSEEKIARGKYDEECKLVVAYGYEGKKSGKAEKPVPMALTLAPSNPASVKHGEKFKGISDWAVKLTAVSSKLDGVNPDGYYLCSSVVRLGAQTADGVAIGTEGVYLKGDCSVCEYLGKDALLWNGDLSDEEVSYIDANGEVKKGRIPKALLGGKGKKTCPCCASAYYADDARWAKYQEKNKLLDGNYSCEKCKDDYETVYKIGGVNHKGYKACQEDGTGKKTHGKVLARVRWQARAWVLDDNKIYQCQHCNVWVYDPDLKRKTCDICGASYCSSCFKKDEKYVMLDGQTACQNCCENATSVKNIAKSSVRSLKGYSVAWCTDVYAKDEIRQGSLFVKVTANLTPVPYSNGGNVAQCAHCGKWIYYDGKVVKKCVTCNEFIGEKCNSEIHKTDSSGHKPYKLLNADQYYCNRCKTGVPLAGGKKLYEEIRMPNTQRTGAVLDNGMDRMVDSIVHCAGCNQKIFYNRWDVAEYTSCELCGRILERTCASKLKNDRFLGKKICPLCEADKRKMKGSRSYASELEKATRAVDVAVEERTAIESRNEDLQKRWEQVVWNTIERYAPYFKLSHRISVLRAKRKGKASEDVLKVIVDTFDFEKNNVLRFPSLALNETVLPKEIGTDGKKNRTKKAQVREYVYFRIRIKSTAYCFVYRNGKITFWGGD